MGKNSGGGASPTPTNGNGSDFASANDKGPVGIITEDPTCAAWSKVGGGLTDAEQRVRWPDRDPSVPAASWSPDQRTTFESVAQAMNGAADQAIALAKATPHRVMRELYEQFIAYARAFAQRIPSYTPRDNDLARVADGVGGVLANVCGAITYGSAQAEAPLVRVADPPSSVSPPSDSAEPRRLLTDDNAICSEWVSLLKKFLDDTASWQAISETIPATQWTSEQRAAYEAVVPVMSQFADDVEALGRRSGNAKIEDFAVLSAQYRRAFVNAIPTYTPADNYLASTATYIALTVDQACKAVSSG
ncbi:hypothetical protein [Mycobacterium sp. ACS1612]|uniref:hypothetical protein n=1 Tax=Mycobacterium sp. ACS1612 TaxID=1834117 RepID=UPI001E3249C0|nr:hypothetical protein [Mycobacterium sp. ACS1612]